MNALHKTVKMHTQLPFKRQAGEEGVHHVRFAAPDTAPEVQPCLGHHVTLEQASGARPDGLLAHRPLGESAAKVIQLINDPGLRGVR